MNLYVFTVHEKRIYVVEDSWKAARNLLLHKSEYKTLKLPELVGRRLIAGCTMKQGIVNEHDVFSIAPWWTCRCGGKSFIVLDDGSVGRCKQCGREIRVFTQGKLYP